MSTASRIIKNTGILYIKVGISTVCSIFSTRFILQSLGISDFGIYNIVASIVVMLTFLNQSMAAATQRFISFSKGESNSKNSISVFNVSVVIHFILALFISLFLLTVGYFAFEFVLQIPPQRTSAATYVYFFMILSTFFSMITVPYNAVLIANENMMYYSIIGSIISILKLIISYILFYYNGDRLILYGLLIACISILELIVPRIYCKRTYSECHINYKRYFDKQLFKKMINFAGWQLLYSSSSILTIQGTSIILNSFFGVVVNAAQGIAKQMSGQLMILSNTLLNALNPVIVKNAGAGAEKSFIKTTILGSKMAFLLVIIFGIPALIEMPYILKLWLENVPDYAITFCRFEIIQQLLASLTITLTTSVSAKGDIKSFQIFSAITYFGRLPLIIFFLKIGGNPVVVYFISTFAVLILCVGRVYYAKVKSGLVLSDFFKNVIVPSSLLTILMLICTLPIIYIINESFLRFILIFFISTTSMFLGLIFFALTKYEKQLIFEIFNKIKGYAKR